MPDPIYQNYTVWDYQDATLEAAGLGSGADMSGWTVRALVQNQFGGSSGWWEGWCASGYNNVSGLNLTDNLNGYLLMSVPGSALSGLNPGNFALSVERLDSGFRTPLLEGWLTKNPVGEP